VLRARVATAVLLGSLLMGTVWLAPTGALALLLAGLAGIAAWEWTALMGVQAPAARVALVAGFLATLVPAWGVLVASPASVQVGLYLVAALWLGVLGWLGRLARGEAAAPSAAGAAVIGWLVLAPTWLAVVYLHGQAPWGAFWVTLLFALVWGADSGAYFAGRAWGRHRLAPRISPGKSWEGVLGGGAAALLAGGALVGLLGPATPAPLFLTGLMVAVIAGSVVGDLLESALKRQRSIKDSGGILPGHGGVLDRIDSLTAAAPIMAAGVAWWQSGT